MIPKQMDTERLISNRGSSCWSCKFHTCYAQACQNRKSKEGLLLWCLKFTSCFSMMVKILTWVRRNSRVPVLFSTIPDFVKGTSRLIRHTAISSISSSHIEAKKQFIMGDCTCTLLMSKWKCCNSFQRTVWDHGDLVIIWCVNTTSINVKVSLELDATRVVHINVVFNFKRQVQIDIAI